METLPAIRAEEKRKNKNEAVWNTNWISLFWGRVGRGGSLWKTRVWCSLPCRSAFGVVCLIQCEGFTWAHSLNVFVSIWSPLHIPDFTFYCADQELITERWEVGSEHLSKGCVNGSWADEIGGVFLLEGSGHPAPFSLFFLLLPTSLILISPEYLRHVIVCTPN